MNYTGKKCTYILIKIELLNRIKINIYSSFPS